MPGLYGSGYRLAVEYFGNSSTGLWVNVNSTPAWVPYAGQIAPGTALSGTSVPGGTQYEAPLALIYFSNPARWIAYYNGVGFGHILASSAGFEQMDTSACRANHYSEALDIDQATTDWMDADMGSGVFTTGSTFSANFGTRANIRATRYYTSAGAGGITDSNASAYATDTFCYNALRTTDGSPASAWSPTLFFGGPGGDGPLCTQDPNCDTGISSGTVRAQLRQLRRPGLLRTARRCCLVLQLHHQRVWDLLRFQQTSLQDVTLVDPIAMYHPKKTPVGTALVSILVLGCGADTTSSSEQQDPVTQDPSGAPTMEANAASTQPQTPEDTSTWTQAQCDQQSNAALLQFQSNVSALVQCEASSDCALFDADYDCLSFCGADATRTGTATYEMSLRQALQDVAPLCAEFRARGCTVIPSSCPTSGTPVVDYRCEDARCMPVYQTE